jgi:hypothetical protein
MTMTEARAENNRYVGTALRKSTREPVVVGSLGPHGRVKFGIRPADFS